jgi:hypothetical protein
MNTYANIVNKKLWDESYMRGVDKDAISRKFAIVNPGKWRVSKRNKAVVVSDTMNCGSPYYAEYFVAEFENKQTALAVCRVMNRMKRKLEKRVAKHRGPI